MSDLNPAPSAPAATPAAPAPANETLEPNAGASAEGATPPTDEPPKPKGPSRLQTRIDELTRRHYDEQRRAEAAEAQLAQFRRQQEHSHRLSELDRQEPQIDQFQSLAEYQRAYANYTVQKATAVSTAQWEQRMQEQAAHDAKFAAQAAQQQARIQFENQVIERKLAEGAKKYPDFQQVVTNNDLPTVRGTPLAEIILEADNAVDITYSLAKNPSELERLLSLHPVQAAKEINRMDQKFAGVGSTSAPPPPPQRNGTQTVVKNYDDMSTREHAKTYWGRKK